MSVSSIPNAVTPQQIVAAVATTSAADLMAVQQIAPTVDRPIGLDVALSQTPSRFIRNAKLTKGAAARSFNALHFS